TATDFLRQPRGASRSADGAHSRSHHRRPAGKSGRTQTRTGGHARHDVRKPGDDLGRHGAAQGARHEEAPAARPGPYHRRKLLVARRSGSNGRGERGGGVSGQQALDLYCERTDASFWSEPLNALSNAAFLVAAVLLARRARADGGRAPRDIDALAVLIALIGFGSFTFHTVATVWASLLDVLFIQIYIYVYLARYLRRIVGVNLVWMYGGLVLYWLFEQAVTGGFEPGALNGSYRYLPALLA